VDDGVLADRDIVLLGFSRLHALASQRENGMPGTTIYLKGYDIDPVCGWTTSALAHTARHEMMHALGMMHPNDGFGDHITTTAPCTGSTSACPQTPGYSTIMIAKMAFAASAPSRLRCSRLTSTSPRFKMSPTARGRVGALMRGRPASRLPSPTTHHERSAQSARSRGGVTTERGAQAVRLLETPHLFDKLQTIDGERVATRWCTRPHPLPSSPGAVSPLAR
jgi:hypothetical protein